MDNLDASINKGAVIVIVEHVSKRGQSDPLKLGSSFRKGEVVIHHLFDRKYFKPLSIIQKLGLLLLSMSVLKEETVSPVSRNGMVLVSAIETAILPNYPIPEFSSGTYCLIENSMS
jgi:hypothetical protein